MATCTTTWTMPIVTAFSNCNITMCCPAGKLTYLGFWLEILYDIVSHCTREMSEYFFFDWIWLCTMCIAHIPLVNSFPKTNIFVLHMKYSNVSDIFEYSSKTKNHDQLVSQTRLRIIDTSLANETKNGSKSDSVFRQHAASIYGFVCQLVLFRFVCQKNLGYF